MKKYSLLFEFIQELCLDYNGDLDLYLDHLLWEKSLMESINAKFSKALGAECCPTKYVDAKITILASLYDL